VKICGQKENFIPENINFNSFYKKNSRNLLSYLIKVIGLPNAIVSAVGKRTV
jgi:hypothetical protein